MIINSDEQYVIPIKGFGEIYEMMSINRLLRRLNKEYGACQVYLAANREHYPREGMTAHDLIQEASSEKREILESGRVDCPPWKGAPKQKEISETDLPPFKKKLAKVLFPIFVKLECFRKAERAHMVYVAVKA